MARQFGILALALTLSHIMSGTDAGGSAEGNAMNEDRRMCHRPEPSNFYGDSDNCSDDAVYPARRTTDAGAGDAIAADMYTQSS